MMILTSLSLAQLFHSFSAACSRLDPTLPPLDDDEEIWLGDEKLYHKMNMLALKELSVYRQWVQATGLKRQTLQLGILNLLWGECHDWLE